MYDLKDWRGQKSPSTHHSHVIFSDTEKPYKAHLSLNVSYDWVDFTSRFLKLTCD